MKTLRVWIILSWIALPAGMFGGTFLLQRFLNHGAGPTPFQMNWLRAGHAHGNVLVLMSLLYYTFLDQTSLSVSVKRAACVSLLVGILAQTYRIAGLLFLYPFLYYGVLPAGFAVPAAVGDFLTGLAARLVGFAVAKRRPNASAWATAWNIFGVLDLIGAPIAAVLSHAQVLALYPLALVPLFVGPPLGLLTHVYSLRNLATAVSADKAGLNRGGS